MDDDKRRRTANLNQRSSKKKAKEKWGKKFHGKTNKKLERNKPKKHAYTVCKYTV